MLQVFGIIFFLLSFASCKDISVEVCEMKTFDAICQQPDEVLVIKQALLGRMKKGKCMLEDFGFFNCSSDVKAEMDAFCTGKKECHVKVDDTSFTRATPCHADLKNHLQLTYSCVKVLFPDSSCSVVDFTGSSSSSSLSPSPAFPLSGFISSVIVEKTGCGLTNSPLTLRAGEGQRINLTLHDVTYGMMLIRASKDRQVVDSTPGRGSTEDQKTLGLHFMISGTCRVYATVRDSDSQDLLGRGSSICGSQGSVVNVFTSTSNVIEIRFMGAQKVKDSRQSSSSSSSSSPSSSVVSMDDILKSPQFLFHYSVIGCSEGELPKETWKRKSGDGRSVILGCPGSDVTWEMICNQNNQWEGRARECSQNGILPFISGVSKIYTSLVVGSIAVVVSCCVLIFGVVCIRRNLKLRSNSRSMCADEQYGLRSACHEGVKGEAKMHSTGSYIPEEMYQDGNEYARMRMQLREQLSKSHGSRNFLVRIAADNSGPTVVQEPSGYDEQNEHIYESADTLKLQLEMCSNQPSIPVFPGPQVSIQMAKPFQEQVTYESTANKYPVTKPTPLPKPPSEIIQKQTIPHHLQTFDETKQGNYSL